MSRRGILLFVGSSIIGGLPWIFTKVLLEKFQPSSIVLIRALVAGFVMLLYALQQRTLFAALKKWPWILVFALIQMTIPWWLTSFAQKSIDTTVVGLLMAATPIFALLFAFIEREHSAITRSRIAGVITGLVGVTCLIGIDAAIGKSDLGKVLLVVVCTMGFAYGPRLVRRHLSEVPTSGMLAIALIFTAIIWLGPGAADVHDIVGPNLRGLGVGVYFFTVNIIGYGFGPPIIGKVNDMLGVGANPWNMHYGLLICPLACAVSAVFLYFGSRSLEKQE